MENEELTAAPAGADFYESLTMAEIAMIESKFGIDLTSPDKHSTGEVMAAITAIAAMRLGVEFTRSQAEQLTTTESNQLMDAAIEKAPQRDPEILTLVNQALGKGAAADSQE
ncbi:hypothetical protein [Arcanobacterium canis]